MPGFLTFIKNVMILINALCGKSPTPEPIPTPTPIPPEPAIFSGEELEVYGAINLERKRSGLQLLAINPKLCQASRKHSNWMSLSHSASHFGLNGQGVEDRVKNEKYSATSIGENILKDYNTSLYLVEAMMKYPGTRRIMFGNYKEMGVGSGLSDKKYWTILFTQPGNGPAKLDLNGI